MSRMILSATALAALMVASLADSPAKAQVIDLRIPPIGGVRSGLDYFPGRPGALGVDRSRSVVPTSAQRHLTTLPAPGHPIGRHGGGFGPNVPGGFPIDPSFPTVGFPSGGFPSDPGFGAAGFGSPGFGGACPPRGVSPVIGAVDQLIGEVGAFLQVFGPTAPCVPQGDRIYREALELYQSALAFRQAALAGAPRCDLQRLYAQMDRSCCRLVSRVNSVARGRNGPNIEQVRYIGSLCQQIRFWI